MALWAIVAAETAPQTAPEPVHTAGLTNPQALAVVPGISLAMLHHVANNPTHTPLSPELQPCARQRPET